MVVSNDGEMSRREVLAAAGLAGVAAAVAGVEPALASEDPPSNLVVATVDRHIGTSGLQVTRLDNGASMQVETTAATDIPSESGRRRPARMVTRGETVIIVGPGAGDPNARSVAAAERVVHCNLGTFSDVKR